MANKNRIQAALITYLRKFGSINLLLPDGVGLEIGITQETKHGQVKSDNYCWVVTKRDDRSTALDRYSMTMEFDDPHFVIENQDKGVVSVL